MKLETFPPGQEATKNNPRATLGGGLIQRTKMKVSAGSKTNWLSKPARTIFGV